MVTFQRGGCDEFRRQESFIEGDTTRLFKLGSCRRPFLLDASVVSMSLALLAVLNKIAEA